MSFVGESSYDGASRHPAKRRSAREIACTVKIPSVISGGKSFHNFSKFCKNDQNFIKIVNFHVIFIIHIRRSMPQVEKTNPIRLSPPKTPGSPREEYVEFLSFLRRQESRLSVLLDSASSAEWQGWRTGSG